MNFGKIRNYWKVRALKDQSAQSTTQDVFLREIELSALNENIVKHEPRKIADIGCGDGRTTIALSEFFNEATFSDFDYSQAADKIAKTKSDYVLILPWNITIEVRQQSAQLENQGAKFVSAMPSPRVFE
ncbi:MAG: hypothetical protein CMQ15_16025 [Gammaproteobacteria bacterium]|jgi:methylase of polypeptide subunit release factors|nr:hypothetical protein [Gammaproteobacteria bacterium]MDP6094837.1 class I SAM-dependent methyltransferase [Gammaproteobacteria bacterium]HJN97279.1 class I SAM-dependent methyltransferase [Gammaproteobacteria bacterium]|tara:strand:- start:2665 stop:3051 length:387 start_codon:yes stop_codon:yes gene_type:complete